MFESFIKKYIPSPETIKNNKKLAILNRFFHNPNLWHMNRYSVSMAISIGFFFGYMPFPGHMILATIFSILFEANLPIAVAGVWISNPITIPPMFYLAYKIGAKILHEPPVDFHYIDSFKTILIDFEHIYFPLMLGSLICGITLAVVGNILVRLFWPKKL